MCFFSLQICEIRRPNGREKGFAERRVFVGSVSSADTSYREHMAVIFMQFWRTEKWKSGFGQWEGLEGFYDIFANWAGLVRN